MSRALRCPSTCRMMAAAQPTDKGCWPCLRSGWDRALLPAADQLARAALGANAAQQPVSHSSLKSHRNLD
jgi:hypothetical protein